MEFFNSAVDTLQTIVVGLGGALCVWGGINPVSYTHLCQRVLADRAAKCAPQAQLVTLDNFLADPHLDALYNALTSTTPALDLSLIHISPKRKGKLP